VSRSLSQAFSSVLGGVLCSLVASVVLAQGTGPPEAQLREGEEAYRAHRSADAVPSLRIAAFGFLDKPAMLCEALVYLALAHEASGYHAEAQSTLDRISEAQRRAPTCADARLDAAIRAEFESKFHRRLSVPASPPASAPAVASKPSPAPAPREAAPPMPAPAVASKPSPAPKEPAPPITPAPAAASKAAPSPAPKEPATQARSAGQVEAVNAAPAGNGETTARIKTLAPPVYPQSAREAKAGGTVVLHVLVSETGKAMQVDVVQAVRPDLADAAVIAMQYCTFEPARRDGQPVRGWTTVEVPFRP
jgi:TonB family protein